MQGSFGAKLDRAIFEMSKAEFEKSSLTERLPIFSVIIPTYNRAELIQKTLETVFNQTYPHYEIVVVDNCSTDHTEEALQPLISKGRIRFIKHDKNYERATSRNTGMENATGDFVTFLDSDDYMYPTALADAARFVKENPGIKLFHNLYQLVDPDNRVLYNFSFPSLEDPLRAITDGNFLSCIGDFIHRDIYERYRFDTNPLLTSAEDWDFWLRVVADYRPGRINKINHGIVHHSGRTIKHLDLEQLRGRLSYILAKISGDPHLSAVYAKYLKRLEIGSLIYMSTVANGSRQHTAALKCLLRAYVKDFRVASSLNFMKALGIAVLRWDKGF
jgi:glycosyltransferase involved in cell wall biosynthesis